MYAPLWLQQILLSAQIKSILQDKFDSDILKSELLRDPASSLAGLVDQYNHVLLDLIDKHAPEQTKVVSQRSRNIPWISDNIKADDGIKGNEDPPS